MNKLILALVLLWPMEGLADYAAGLEAYKRGDYATAMREWRPLAEAGDAVAQHNLGVMYDTGQGVPENDTVAVKWYRLAAEQGHAAAQNNLDNMVDVLAKGSPPPPGITRVADVPKIKVVAWDEQDWPRSEGEDLENIKLFSVVLPDGTTISNVPYGTTREKLRRRYARGYPNSAWLKALTKAEQGSAQSQHELGEMFRIGNGVTKDYESAVKWFRLAAEQGFADAQNRLGNMYGNGNGVPKDPAQAYAWFSLSAAQNKTEASISKDALSRTMTPAQMAAAQRHRKDLCASIPNCTSPAEPVAARKAGVRNFQESLRNFMGSVSRTMMLPKAEAGDADAQNHIGIAYRRGWGFSVDNAEAMRWYRLAAAQGHPGAQTSLGNMYAAGVGVPEDDAEAVRWYRLAAAQGYADAETSLGDMYAAGGAGVLENARTAVTWYQLAAAQGHPGAQTSLGNMYAAGVGVPEDDAEAVRWYRLAAEQGFADAQVKLALVYAEGEDAPQDDRESVKWLRRLAESGDIRGQGMLAGMYEDGRGVPKDYVRAYAWINLAGAHGRSHKVISEAKDRLRKIMVRTQISEAQKLSRELCAKIPNCVP